MTDKNTKNKVVNILGNKNFSEDMSKWDFSKVKDMREVFLQDMSKWDFSKVEDMREVFLQKSHNTFDKNNDINLDSATGLYSKKK